MDTNSSRLGEVKINPGTSGSSASVGTAPASGAAAPSSSTSSTASNSANAGQTVNPGCLPKEAASAGPSMHEGDMATMEVVSNGCLTAWRKACAGDEAGSIAMLNDLDKHYPGVLTIQMMTGQVYDHFGKNKEAIEHYKRAITGNEFSSLHVFKLAEAMRKNGDYKGAEGYYRKVLQNAPKFGAAQVGLARCLLATDKQSTEARTLLSEAADDEQSAKDAHALLNQLEPGAKAGN
jgi:tetratricopeptide (TPR) repeat protein